MNGILALDVPQGEDTSRQAIRECGARFDGIRGYYSNIIRECGIPGSEIKNYDVPIAIAMIDDMGTTGSLLQH